MSEKENVHKHLKIKGRVQGVGFRHFTKQNAQSLDIKGWVKNLPDGSVETVISGNAENVNEMIGRLKRGPITAQVSSVDELKDTDTVDNFENFSVRR